MNEAKTLTLEAGKFYRTRRGKKVFIVGQNPFDTPDDDVEFPFGGFVQGGSGDTLEWFRSDGVYGVREGGELDLVAEWVERKRIKGKMFIYEGTCGVQGSYLGDGLNRPLDAKVLACIEIDVLEGAGLGEVA